MVVVRTFTREMPSLSEARTPIANTRHADRSQHLAEHATCATMSMAGGSADGNSFVAAASTPANADDQATRMVAEDLHASHDFSILIFRAGFSSPYSCSCARGQGVRSNVEEVSLFSGPTIARVRVGCVPVVVNLVPLGGRVELRAKQSDEFNVSFHDLHPALRIGVFATGSLAIVAVAVACLGPIEGLHSVWRGFRQIFRGGMAPVAVGAPLVRSMFGVIGESPWFTSLGIVAAKLGAFNLLPLLPLDGGQIIWTAVEWRRKYPDRITFGATYLRLIGTLILTCSWLYAVARVLLDG